MRMVDPTGPVDLESRNVASVPCGEGIDRVMIPYPHKILTPAELLWYPHVPPRSTAELEATGQAVVDGSWHEATTDIPPAAVGTASVT